MENIYDSIHFTWKTYMTAYILANITDFKGSFYFEIKCFCIYQENMIVHAVLQNPSYF